MEDHYNIKKLKRPMMDIIDKLRIDCKKIKLEHFDINKYAPTMDKDDHPEDDL